MMFACSECGCTVIIAKDRAYCDDCFARRRQRAETAEKERDDYRAEVADLLPRMDADAVVISSLVRELAEARKGAEAACHLAEEWRKEVDTRNAQIEELQANVQFWEDVARQESRNRDYYRGLVVEIGEMFGVAARTQDDGGIVDDVLCAKVPELVQVAQAEAARYRIALEDIDWWASQGRAGVRRCVLREAQEIVRAAITNTAQGKEEQG